MDSERSDINLGRFSATFFRTNREGHIVFPGWKEKEPRYIVNEQAQQRLLAIRGLLLLALLLLPMIIFPIALVLQFKGFLENSHIIFMCFGFFILYFAIERFLYWCVVRNLPKAAPLNEEERALIKTENRWKQKQHIKSHYNQYLAEMKLILFLGCTFLLFVIVIKSQSKTAIVLLCISLALLIIIMPVISILREAKKNADNPDWPK